MSRHGDVHPGGLAPRRGQRRAAVLGALPDGVSQPAEHEGPAVGQRVGLRGDARLQRAPILLPEEVDVRGTWGHTDHLQPRDPHLGPRGATLAQGRGVEPPRLGASSQQGPK